MPQNVLDKVWAYFDGAGPLLGTAWPIAYRGGEADRLARLRAMGVRAFPSLLYPHKPAMAAWLNGWAARVRRRAARRPAHRDLLPRGRRRRLRRPRRSTAGARVFKAHVQVGAYDPRDPLLDGVWGQLADAQVPVVVHCGSGPRARAVHRSGAVRRGAGPPPAARRGDRAPGHAGVRRVPATSPAAYDRVHLDTTMAFTDFTEALMPFPPELLPRARRPAATGSCSARDFPNTPYPYVDQLDALAGLGLGDDWLRAVLHDNGARLLGLPAMTHREHPDVPARRRREHRRDAGQPPARRPPADRRRSGRAGSGCAPSPAPPGSRAGRQGAVLPQRQLGQPADGVRAGAHGAGLPADPAVRQRRGRRSSTSASSARWTRWSAGPAT